ncbi:MAG: folate family ECF transporter S component [Clostridia bacterium]|nr:folate family ECF transporter S component [Clostridia bacterium]
MQQKWYQINTRQMCLMGLMIALHFVFGFFNVQITPQLRISLLPFLPIAFIGMRMGPLYGALAGAMGDIINYLLITHVYGGYFPGYTLTAALSGLCYGLFLYRHEINWKRAMLCLLPAVFLFEMGLNTLWTYVTASWGYFIANLPWRIVTNVIEYPLKVLLLLGMGKLLKRIPEAYLRQL